MLHFYYYFTLCVLTWCLLSGTSVGKSYDWNDHL